MTRASNVVDLDAETAGRTRWKWLGDVTSCVGLKPRDKVVALVLCNHFLNERTGKGWPSHEAIAERCASSVSFVQKGLYALEREGFLKTERDGGGTYIDAKGARRGIPCIFVMAFPADRNEPRTDVPGTDVRGTANVPGTDCAVPGTDRACTRYDRPDKPSTEPSIEPSTSSASEDSANSRPSAEFQQASQQQPPQEKAGPAQPPQARPPAGEYDWESSDGTIFIPAARINQWAAAFPGVDVRAQLRHARRDYLSGPLSSDVFCRRFEKGLKTSAEKRRAREAAKPEARAADKEAARIDRERAAKALEVRNRIHEDSLRKRHGGGSHGP